MADYSSNFVIFAMYTRWLNRNMANFNSYIDNLDMTFWHGICLQNGMVKHYRKGEVFVWQGDVIKYFGTEEAQRIQGENGAAIPAYIGCEETWRSAFDAYGEKLNLDVIFDQFDYAVQAVYNSASPKWKSQVLDELTRVYAGSQDLMTGLENMQSIVDTETAKKLADN